LVGSVDEQPRAVLVAWDTLEALTYRHTAFKADQGGREFDAPLLEQLALIPEFVSACGFVNVKGAGYEADDFLAAAVAREERHGGTVLVACGDRDTFQLASDRTTILYPVRAGEMARIGPAEVRARYGVDPEQVPDFIAPRGDAADTLPGAPGAGAVGAATLLRVSAYPRSRAHCRIENCSCRRILGGPYSHPRSTNTERSAPGGAYHPAEP
jgi:DNA polymerase-1